MSFGSRLLEARKIKVSRKKSWPSTLILKAIGRYERDEMKPSIEVAAKMADYLDVSLDYLVSKTDVRLDGKTMKSILEIQQFNQDTQNKIFDYIDLVIRDTKTRQAHEAI